MRGKGEGAREDEGIAFPFRKGTTTLARLLSAGGGIFICMVGRCGPGDVVTILTAAIVLLLCFCCIFSESSKACAGFL
jgi:hypothetical protein